MIGIVDCNSFYASVERVFRPDLATAAIGCLSNNDGCVIAMTPELKAMGVKMGTPAFELRELVRSGRAHLMSSNYELYGDFSHRVQTVLADNSAGIEPYSIDESWVSFDGFAKGQLEDHARDLRSRVKRYTGIPVAVGIAPTRTLAKVANRAAKKVPGYDGVCVLYPGSPQIKGLLQRFPLDDVWGIGGRLSQRLAAMGLHTAWDLRNQDARSLRRRFSVTLERTVLELQGRPAIEMLGMDVQKQRIMTSRAFGRPTANPGEIREAIRHHAQRGAEKLRQQGSLCRAVMVFLRTNPHRPDLPQHNPSLAIELPRPSSDSRDIVAAAAGLLDRLYLPRHAYVKAGCMLLDLIDQERQQISLFDSPQSDADRAKGEKLMAVVDQLNARMGRGTVRFGGAAPSAAWHLRCDNRSPRYTTRWDELPSARA
ncbi:Y-family DNA polymerase [Salinicola sp. NYA28a]